MSASSPTGLVRQVTQTAKELGVPLLGENALEGGLYNQAALDKMLQNIHNFERVTLLRLNPWMFEADNDAESGFQVRGWRLFGCAQTSLYTRVQQ